MRQHRCKAFLGLVLLVSAVSPIVAMSPTHRISADLVRAHTSMIFTTNNVPFALRSSGGGKVQGVGEALVKMVMNNPNIHFGENSFTGTFEIQRLGGRGRGDEFLYGVVSDGDGLAYSNGFQVNYFATVTITGGTGRYAGATGTIDVMVYQYGVFDDNPPLITSEIILDGQYSVP